MTVYLYTTILDLSVTLMNKGSLMAKYTDKFYQIHVDSLTRMTGS